jgi:hypothetical protein
MLYQKNRGTTNSAKEKNLCGQCNGDLGSNVEGRVRSLLGNFCHPNPIDEWAAHLNSWNLEERDLVACWTLLRAIEFNEQFKPKRFTKAFENYFIPLIRQVRDGNTPYLPRGFFVQIARSRESSWGFSLSQEFFDRFRNMRVSNPESYIWAMQANHCLILAGYAPGIQLLRDTGWGYGIVPFDLQKCPTYDHMADWISRSHIDTREPGLYLPVHYKIDRAAAGKLPNYTLPPLSHTANEIARELATRYPTLTFKNLEKK